MPTESSLLDELLDLVPTDLYDVSGELFHSGRTSFERPSSIYILGINPGGDPLTSTDGTVGSNLEAARDSRHHWSSYSDESWEGREPGRHPYQKSVCHMLDRCHLDPRTVPSSNVVFVRSAREATLGAARLRELRRECWPVHERAIEALGVRVVVCFGHASASWVRRQLGAKTQVDHYTETNLRGWTSTTHQSPSGMQVVRLTHPSTADWTNQAADPSELVARARARS